MLLKAMLAQVANAGLIHVTGLRHGKTKRLPKSRLSCIAGGMRYRRLSGRAHGGGDFMLRKWFLTL